MWKLRFPMSCCWASTWAIFDVLCTCSLPITADSVKDPSTESCMWVTRSSLPLPLPLSRSCILSCGRKGREDAVLVWSKESHSSLFNVPRFWRVLTSHEIIQYWADKNSWWPAMSCSSNEWNHCSEFLNPLQEPQIQGTILDLTLPPHYNSLRRSMSSWVVNNSVDSGGIGNDGGPTRSRNWEWGRERGVWGCRWRSYDHS
jgi:hypothetical protein